MVVGERAVRLLFKVSEAAEQLGLSRATVYKEIARGAIKPVKIGAATRLPAEELRRYVDSLTKSEK
jgi:excisionase family DNA binding protein